MSRTTRLQSVRERPLAELSQLQHPIKLAQNSHKTDFFRHREQYQVLAKYFKDRLVGQPKDSFWIMSAGASIGHEAISILITYCRVVKELDLAAPRSIKVIAVDAVAECAETFRNKVYTRYDLQSPIPDWQEYFEPVLDAPDQTLSPVRLRADLKAAVHYVNFDMRRQDKLKRLIAFTPTARGFDAIFFNNVIPHFHNDNVGGKVRRTLKRMLLPDGCFCYLK